MSRTLKAIVIPLLLLDLLAIFVGFPWVLLLNWKVFLAATVMCGIGSFIISLASTSTIFLLPLLNFFERRKSLSMVTLIGSFGLSIIYGIISFWSIKSIQFFMEAGQAASSTFPFLLISYVVSAGPLLWMAQNNRKSDPNDDLAVPAFFLQLSSILMVVTCYVKGNVPAYFDLLPYFLGPMCISFIFQMHNAYFDSKARFEREQKGILKAG